MAAGIGDGEREGLMHLLASLHIERERASIGREHAARALIEGEIGLEPFSVMLKHVGDAVDAIGGFLPAGQRQAERAARAEILRAQTDHQINEHRRHGFIVGAAAAVEETVFLDQRERIALPVGAVRVDHIDMRQQQQRAPARSSTQHRHQIAVVGAAIGRDHAQIVLTITRSAQSRRHGFSRARAGAGGFRGVDLDQFFVNGAEGGAIRGKFLGMRGGA